MLQRGQHLLIIITVLNADHAPPIAFKALADILPEGYIGTAFNGNLIIIIQHNQLVQLQRTGQRGSLAADAFHHAAVSGEGVGMMIDDIEAGLVKMGSQHGFRDRETDGI